MNEWDFGSDLLKTGEIVAGFIFTQNLRFYCYNFFYLLHNNRSSVTLEFPRIIFLSRIQSKVYKAVLFVEATEAREAFCL